MCLITHRTKDLPPIPLEFWDSVNGRNKDGWGIMWLEEVVIPGVEGEAPVTRMVTRARRSIHYKQFYKFYKELEDKNCEMLVHFRFATQGTVSKENCHPFLVYKNPDDPTDRIYMMHNGQVDYPFKAPKDHSDTLAFVNQVLKPMLEWVPNPHQLIQCGLYQFMLEKYCGTSSKLVFMGSQGARPKLEKFDHNYTVFINKQMFHKHKDLGCNLSSYMYDYPKKEYPSYEDTRKGWGHYERSHTVGNIIPYETRFRVRDTKDTKLLTDIFLEDLAFEIDNLKEFQEQCKGLSRKVYNSDIIYIHKGSAYIFGSNYLLQQSFPNAHVWPTSEYFKFGGAEELPSARGTEQEETPKAAAVAEGTEAGG